MILGMKGSPARPDPTTEGIEIPIRIRFPDEEGPSRQNGESLEKRVGLEAFI